MLGGFLALLSAATFAINNVSARRGVITASVEQGLAITIPIGVPLFALAMTLAGSWATLFGFSSKAVWLLAIAGILHFVWARYCFYRATKALGTMLVAPLQQLSMFLALLLAMIFLGEKLTPLRFFGLVLVIGGPILAFSSRGQVLSAPSTTSFRPNYVEGYFWGILSATGSCISPILIRLAIQDGGAGAGLAGGFISYTAATVIFIIVIVAAGRTAHVLSMERTNAYWFANAGFFVFVSHMFRYLAYVFAPVTVVAPIERTSTLFRMVFAWFVNREHEVFQSRVIAASVISLIGAVALSISTDVVLSVMPLPGWLQDFARAEWP